MSEVMVATSIFLYQLSLEVEHLVDVDCLDRIYHQEYILQLVNTQTVQHIQHTVI